MSKKICELYPKVTSALSGKEVDSRLYQDLLKEDGLKYPRPVANMLYASYLVNDIEKQMEAAKNSDGSPKYKKNVQGQFNAKDYIDFIGFDKAASEWNDVSEESYRWGITDAPIGGNKIDFTNAEDALKKADDFNKAHKGLVASVNIHSSPNGAVYNIYVYNKDSKSITIPMIVSNNLQAWQVYKQVFNKAGVDLDALTTKLPSVFSAFNSGLDHYLRNISEESYNVLNKTDALALMTIDDDSNEVKRVINSFGSLEDAAQAINDYNMGNIYITKQQDHLLRMAINHAQKLHGIDADALVSQVDTLISNSNASSPELAIKREIEKLDKKYHIEKTDINRYSRNIKSLSDATAKAIIQLKRRIDELYRMKGTSDEGRRLENMVKSMEKEIAFKHYCAGILDFLGEAVNSMKSIDDILANIPQSGDATERVFGTMKSLRDIKRIRDQYIDIVSALSSDNTAMDEDINQIDVDRIKEQAKKVKDYFEKKDKVIDELTQNAVKDLMRIATNGKIKESELNEVLEKAVKGANWADRLLYSAGTADNLLINAAGSIMGNQEYERNQAIKEYRRRIDRATDKLHKAGFDSKFMYEDQTHIISDINWDNYDAAKASKRKNLKAQGYTEFDLKQKMEDWVEQNTEDRVVDNITGRTERVPNQKYRKKNNFQEGWASEQVEYYNTMMQLKGELESLYPEYAQNYYLPPQVRRNSLDAMTSAKSAKEVGKAVWNKVKEPFEIRENDTDYAENGIIGGEDVRFSEGNYDDTVKKEVPIFFQKRVKDGELLYDFSTGLIREAGSAVNYDAMMNIRDVMECMRDYADMKSSATVKNDTELVNGAFTRITQTLFKWGMSNNVSEIINGFIDQHIYGERKDSQGLPSWMSKLTDSVINYTSFKGLAFNIPGAVANGLMGVQQIFIESGCGEFFGIKDSMWAASKLFGNAGTMGDLMEIATNNVSHKSSLMKDLFDPIQEGWESDKNKRYHSSVFRNIISHDCRFIGYGIGEYYIHMLPMYAVLHREKVLLDGKKVSLYDALEVTKKQDGNSELVVKQGVTDLNGRPITDVNDSFIKEVRGKIQYVNKTMHGAMDADSKGLIHRYMAGRLLMNFRQWMVGHYSRRFRGRHFDFDAGDFREGYWVSLWKGLFNADTKEAWKEGMKKDAALMFMKDFATFMFRASSQWSNLTPMQKSNVKRARTEILMWIALLGLSFVLGAPDDHKKEFWKRCWIYQTRRMLNETESTMPLSPKWLDSTLQIMQSPMAGINTLNSMLYIIMGLFNGDITDTVKSGSHKGENRYMRNVIKYDLPFFKDWERIQNFDTDDSLFKAFDYSVSSY